MEMEIEQHKEVMEIEEMKFKIDQDYNLKEKIMDKAKDMIKTYEKAEKFQF